MQLPNYPSYQLPPQVQALANGGPRPSDVYMRGPRTDPPPNQNSMAQAQAQPLTPDQQAAVNGSGPDIFPTNDPRAQFLAGAQQGLAGGLRRFPAPATPGTPQQVNQAPDPMNRQFTAPGVNAPTGYAPPAGMGGSGFLTDSQTGGQLPPQVSALANQPLDDPNAVVAPPTPGTPQWIAQQQAARGSGIGGNMNGGRWSGMPYQTR